MKYLRWVKHVYLVTKTSLSIDLAQLSFMCVPSFSHEGYVGDSVTTYSNSRKVLDLLFGLPHSLRTINCQRDGKRPPSEDGI